MTDMLDWQGKTGSTWASEWKRTDRSFSGLTDRLLGRASARRFDCALDVGCGAGELSLALARGHGGAQVIGLDVSEELIDVARRRGAQLHNVSFEVGDAAAWRSDDAAPDLIVSRHGVMFFVDPPVAFAHLAASAKPDARLVFSCFRERALNPWASRVSDLLPPGSVSEPAPGAPGPFAFADKNHVARILQKGGWMDVSFEEIDYAFIAGTGEDPVADACSYFLSIGPAARAAAQLDEAARGHFLEKLTRYLEANREGSIVALRAAAWIVTARPAGRR